MPALPKTCRVCGAEYGRGETFCPVDGGRLSTPSELERQRRSDPAVGTIFDERYKILRVIGEGGMGIVYEAEHIKIDKRVAIKVLRHDFTRRQDVVARFQQEAKSASRIGHPHIIDVSDFGETPNGACYIVMEMLHGEDLADLLAREYVLSPLRATGIVYQCCRALSAAHKLNIVHRDLKPENVFILEKDGEPDFVKIVDFGVAKMTDLDLSGVGGRRLTTTGMIFGTPEYMSPEQARGERLDHRVDIYSIGVILYELVTGRVPYEGENFMEILNKHAQDPVPPLRETNPATNVSPELDAAIQRALSKDPRTRFQTMDEMATALEQCPEMPSRIPRESVLPPNWSAISTPPAPPPSASPLPKRVSSRPGDVPRRPARSGGRVHFATPMPDRPLSQPPGMVRRIGLVVAALSVGVIGAMLVPRILLPPEATAPAEVRDALPPSPLPTSAVPAAGRDALQPRSTDEDRAAASPAASDPAASPAAAGGSVDATPPARVRIRVTTEPPGARVQWVGHAELCGPTPCTLELQAGEPARLLATRGGRVAKLDLTPQADTEVRMVLTRPRGKRAGGQERASDGASDALKIPPMFRR